MRDLPAASQNYRIIDQILKSLPALEWVLTAQLAISLCAPPMDLGVRTLFWGDVFFFLWPILYILKDLLDRPRRRVEILWFLGISSALFLGIWVHGAYRVSMVEALLSVHQPLLSGDHFNLWRESVVGARFLSWLWAGYAVCLWKPELQAVQRLGRMAMRLLGAVSAVSILCWIFPEFGMVLGDFYGSGVGYRYWQGRIYGLFRSPNEGGVTLGLGLLCAFSFYLRKQPRNWRGLSLLSVLLLAAVYLSQSMTTVLSWGAVSLFAALSLLRGKVRWVIGGGGALSFLATVSYGLHSSEFLRVKFSNLLFRLGPWKVFWQVASRRWDLMAFGFGWTDYHADSTYLFLFNRGGFLLLGLALGWATRVLKGQWKRWDLTQRNIFVFVAFSGLTIDSIILRPFAATLICLAIPLLLGSVESGDRALTE